VLAEAFQATLEEGVPLEDVTFCVVDLETTGGSPVDSRITEIGAVTYRGGERLGVLETLVDPGVPIPRSITHLTGIDDRTVAGAPPIEAVLPTFAEFARGAVFVAHNARFDFTFLNVALERWDFDPLPPPPVCTARLARRVVWPDVPNVRLHTLAQYFRTAVRPNHRALADAQACAEVLHGLLDLAKRLGIRTLGDLHLAVRARGRPNFGKIALADHLPRAAGVYLFKARDGRVLYVGTSKDLRERVSRISAVTAARWRGFSTDHVGRGLPCGSEPRPRARACRIRHHEPRYNRRADVAVSTCGPTMPRRSPDPGRPGAEAGAYLGPFASSQRAPREGGPRTPPDPPVYEGDAPSTVSPRVPGRHGASLAATVAPA
jgi:DNA polymerase-3 subunit epsilon